MARAQLLQFQVRSIEAHSHSYVTKMIDKNAPSGRVRSSRHSAAQTPRGFLKPQTFIGTRRVSDAGSESAATQYPIAAQHSLLTDRATRITNPWRHTVKLIGSARRTTIGLFDLHSAAINASLRCKISASQISF